MLFLYLCISLLTEQCSYGVYILAVVNLIMPNFDPLFCSCSPEDFYLLPVTEGSNL